MVDSEGVTEALWWAMGYRHKWRRVSVKKHQRTTARKTARKRRWEVCLWWAEIIQGVDSYPSRCYLFTSSSKTPPLFLPCSTKGGSLHAYTQKKEHHMALLVVSLCLECGVCYACDVWSCLFLFLYKSLFLLLLKRLTPQTRKNPDT